MPREGYKLLTLVGKLIRALPVPCWIGNARFFMPMPDKNDLKPNEESHKVTPLIGRLGGPMTPEQRKVAKALFLDAFEEEANVTVACEHAGIAPKTAYQWRKADNTFAKAWQEAVEASNDVIRHELFRRAVKGVETFVVSQGRVVYVETEELDEDGKKIMAPLTEKKYSDSLMTLLLKSRMPEFRDKQQVEHNGVIEFKTEWGGGALAETEEE